MESNQKCDEKCKKYLGNTVEMVDWRSIKKKNQFKHFTIVSDPISQMWRVYNHLCPIWVLNKFSSNSAAPIAKPSWKVSDSSLAPEPINLARFSSTSSWASWAKPSWLNSMTAVGLRARFQVHTSVICSSGSGPMSRKSIGSDPTYDKLIVSWGTLMFQQFGCGK